MDKAHAARVAPNEVVRKRDAAQRPRGRHRHRHPRKPIRKRSCSVRRNHGRGQEDVSQLQELGSVSGGEYLSQRRRLGQPGCAVAPTSQTYGMRNVFCVPRAYLWD